MPPKKRRAWPRPTSGTTAAAGGVPPLLPGACPRKAPAMSRRHTLRWWCSRAAQCCDAWMPPCPSYTPKKWSFSSAPPLPTAPPKALPVGAIGAPASAAAEPTAAGAAAASPASAEGSPVASCTAMRCGSLSAKSAAIGGIGSSQMLGQEA